MSSATRFGRRLPLPSTQQIPHDLKMFVAADKIKGLEIELANLTRVERTANDVAAPGSVR